MSINKKNIARHELIGLEVEIASSNKKINGMKGKIIDETKNTITIKPNKMILKNQATFKTRRSNRPIVSSVYA